MIPRLNSSSPIYLAQNEDPYPPNMAESLLMERVQKLLDSNQVDELIKVGKLLINQHFFNVSYSSAEILTFILQTENEELIKELYLYCEKSLVDSIKEGNFDCVETLINHGLPYFVEPEELFILALLSKQYDMAGFLLKKLIYDLYPLYTSDETLEWPEEINFPPEMASTELETQIVEWIKNGESQNLVSLVELLKLNYFINFSYLSLGFFLKILEESQNEILKAEVRPYFLKEKWDKNINHSQIEKCIQTLIDDNESGHLLELIQLLKKDYFTNLKYIWSYFNRIADAIVKAKNVDLVKVIFPHFKGSANLERCEFFHDSIEEGNLEFVKALVKANPWCPPELFLQALWANQYGIADFLQSTFQYDLNAPYPFKQELDCPEKSFVVENNCITAAYLAVGKDDPTMLSWLMERGANCMAPNQRPKNAYNYRRCTHDNNNPLTYSIQKGSLKCFNLLVNMKDVDLNILADRRDTPILVALDLNQFEMAQILIAKKANVHLADSEGITPLMLAAVRGHEALFNELLQAGADPRCLDSDKNNLWFFAKDEAIFQLLKKIIPDLLNAENCFGKTPLASTIFGYEPERITALLLEGADPKIILPNIDRKIYQLPMSGDITPLEVAIRALQKEEESLRKYPDCKIAPERIEALKKTIKILKNPPKPKDGLIPMASKASKASPLNPELNQIAIHLGSAEEIEKKILQAVPECHFNFVQNLSQLLANKTFKPEVLISALYIAIYSNDGLPDFMKQFLFNIQVPAMIPAFTDNVTMQNHLRTLLQV